MSGNAEIELDLPALAAAIDESIASNEQALRDADPFAILGSVVDLATEPKPLGYLIDGLPFAGGGKVDAIQGEPNAGKSPFALLLALCVAVGMAFLGRRVLRPGPVLYLDGETGQLAHVRFRRLCHALKVDPSTVPLEFRNVETSFSVPYVQALEAYLRAHPKRLVVIDTYGAMLGADVDTNTPEFAHWLRQLGLVSRALEVVIVVLIHERKGKGDGLEKIAGNYQGAGALQGVVMLTRTGKGNEAAIRVSCSRAPEGDFEPFDVVWKDTDWRDALPGEDRGRWQGLKAEVSDKPAATPSEAVAAVADAKRAKAASAMLALLEGSSGGVSERGVIKAAKGAKETTLRRWFAELVADGVILQTQVAQRTDRHGVAEPVYAYSAAPSSPVVVEARLRWGIVR